MKKGVVIFSALITLFVACTKEKSIEGGVKQKLLVRTVAKIGSDSLVNSFGYDGSDRLNSYITDFALQGNQSHSQVTFNYANNGILQGIITDSSDYTLNYSTSDQRYTSAITNHVISGQSIKDSTAFTYDANGKVLKAERFFDAGLSGGYEEVFKTEYAYDGDGNVIKATSSVYDPISGTYSLYEENTYEYDTKVNPLRFGIEAFIINEPERTSAFNVTKKTITNAKNPSLNDTITYTYTYNSENKPDTATVLYQSIGVPFPVTFYYQ